MADKIKGLITQALSYGKQGRLPQAMEMYRRALAKDPDNFDALHGMGIIQAQIGNIDQASRLFTLACAIRPDNYLVNYHLGNALDVLKCYQEALLRYDRTIAIEPRFVPAYHSRGLLLQKLSRYQEALASYDKAIALQPDRADLHYCRGFSLFHLQRFGDAVSSYDRAIALKPDFAEAFNNRGLALQWLNHYQEALASYDKAISIKPDYIGAWSNRSIVLKELKRFQDALTSCDRAIALDPDIAETWSNRGDILIDLKRYEDALVSYDRAISLKPDYAQAKLNKGHLMLLLGDYEAGWPLYEWRWKTEELKYSVRHFKQPVWLGGESLTGKTILLYTEQGFGDIIQFVRYVPMVEGLGAKVILELPAPLVTLLGTLEGTFEIITKGDPPPEFDLHCPIMSLPLAFKTTVDTIPVDIPYLAVNPQKQSEMRTRIGPKTRQRIGLVWSGRAQHRKDLNRSIPLRTMAPLMSLDVEYHSLQKEIRSEDAAVLKEFPQIQQHNDEMGDFADTAALICEMDVVITVDTSVAHLTGALGKAAWILLPYSPDWRWMTEAATTPWYPSVRLFRQQQPGDWPGVISYVQSELIKLA